MDQLLAANLILILSVGRMDKGELIAAFFISALIVLGALYSHVEPCSAKWDDDGLRIKCYVKGIR